MLGRKNKVKIRGEKHRWLYRGRKMEADLHTDYKVKGGEQYIEVVTAGTLARIFDDGNVVVERRSLIEVKKPGER